MPLSLLGIPLEDERREFGNLLRSRQRNNSRVGRDRRDLQQREPGNDFCRNDLRQAHLAVCDIVAIERETIGESVIDWDRIRPIPLIPPLESPVLSISAEI
jgi:hypothetical protein